MARTKRKLVQIDFGVIGPEADERVARLDSLARALNVNRSQLVQKIADGELLLCTPEGYVVMPPPASRPMG